MANRFAVVTGGNKGIGFEICRQLASNGILVVLTARDENRGLQAVHELKHKYGFSSHNIVFHQLDVAHSSSVSSLADFIKAQFGKLDILVNNAGIFGCIVHEHVMKSVPFEQIRWDEATVNTYDLAEKCLKTNYYGAKEMVRAFLPLLQLSDSPRIVNVTSTAGNLKNVKNEWARGVLSDVDHLTEERVEQVLNKFMEDFKEGLLETWSSHSPAYILSKAALNAYTRIIAKKYPSFSINCVCPGFVKTDATFHSGDQTTEEGAKGPVKLALLPDGGPSGRCFSWLEEASF